MNPDQIAPIVCNIGYLRAKTDERADDKCCDWREDWREKS